MLFDESNLSTEALSSIQLDTKSHESVWGPRRIFKKQLSQQYHAAADIYPPQNDAHGWQALMDAIDFYEIRSDYELFTFVQGQGFAEVNPDIPVTSLIGDIAKEMYGAFRNVAHVNRTKKLSERFSENHYNVIAVKLLKEGYRPKSYQNGRLILEKTPTKAKANTHETNAERGIYQTDPMTKTKSRERWADLMKTLSPKT